MYNLCVVFTVINEDFRLSTVPLSTSFWAFFFSSGEVSEEGRTFEKMSSEVCRNAYYIYYIIYNLISKYIF
jgi:hypothetical protein